MLGKYDTSKGLCLILCYTKFDKAKPLPGNTKDVAMLKKTFERFQFEVDSFENKSKQKTVEWLDEWVEKIKVGQYSCLAVCITSHGDDGLFLCTDGEFETSDLYEMLSESKCAALRGKLKMFFIDTCQGDQVNRGIDTSAKGPEKERIASYSDYLSYIANYHGYMALSFHNTGSLFTRCLCTVLNEYYQNHHLDEMLTKTNGEVSADVHTLDGKPAMQMPYFKSTLKHLVYFTSQSKLKRIKIKTVRALTANSLLQLFVCGKMVSEIVTTKAENASLQATLGEYGEIHFEGVNEETVEVFIKLINGETEPDDLTLENVKEVLVCAHELKLKDIKDRCQRFLEYNPEYLSEKTAIDVLVFAHQFDASILKKMAMKMINKSKTIRLEEKFNKIVEITPLFEELCLSTI